MFLWLKRATSMALLVFENLVKRSTPRDHAAVRVAIQKPTIRGHQGKRIPSWMSKHPAFCSILNQINDDHLYPEDPFGALADLSTLMTHPSPLLISKSVSRKPENGPFTSSYVRHRTTWEPSF